MTQERVPSRQEPQEGRHGRDRGSALRNADRSTVWAVLLIGLGVLFLAGNLGWLQGLDQWLWGLLFAIGGGAFLAWFLRDRKQWWALIPAGILLTLGVVAWLDAFFPRFDGGGVFFLGLAATFGYLYLLPEREARQRWAIYPAVAALALALATLLSGAVTGVVVSLLLIAAGSYLIWQRATRPPNAGLGRPTSGPHREPPAAPQKEA